MTETEAWRYSKRAEDWFPKSKEVIQKPEVKEPIVEPLKQVDNLGIQGRPKKSLQWPH